MFRYYVIFFSLCATGIGFLLTKCSLPGTNYFIQFVSFIFILITLIFSVIDCRNRKLIELSKDLLRDFEKIHFKQERQQQIFNNQERMDKGCEGYFTHTNSFRAIYFITIISAILAIFYSVYFRKDCPKKDCPNCKLTQTSLATPHI